MTVRMKRDNRMYSLFSGGDRRRMTRRADPDTSHAAADRVYPDLTTLQKEVLQAFRQHRELTDLELEDIFGMHGSTYRTRRRELTDRGLIFDTKQRKFQKGSSRIIWRLKQ